jgi:hypothetical protein
MSSRKLEGIIYKKIREDEEKQHKGDESNYWSWIRGKNMEDDDGSIFDVVKKRKAMEAPENAQEENAPDALSSFEAFEFNVLPALNGIRKNEEEFKRKEAMELEASLAMGILPPMSGGVYFAWSSCLNCMKIGATRRECPQIRLRELSRYVTVPFTLAAWIPTPTPFKLETAAHSFFKQKRINTRGSGAGIEFFHVTTPEAMAYSASAMHRE